MGPVTFSGQVLLEVVEFLINPSNSNNINTRAMKIGMWARLTIRKLHSKFQVSSIAGTWLGQVLMWSSLKVVEFDIGPVSGPVRKWSSFLVQIIYGQV